MLSGFHLVCVVCVYDSFRVNQMDKLVGRIRDALAIVGVFVVIILIGLL